MSGFVHARFAELRRLAEAASRDVTAKGEMRDEPGGARIPGGELAAERGEVRVDRAHHGREVEVEVRVDEPAAALEEGVANLGAGRAQRVAHGVAGDRQG